MKFQNTSPIRPASQDVIQGHIAAFVADLRAAGYARDTLSAKGAALERFINWRGRRKWSSHDPTESEISGKDNMGWSGWEEFGNLTANENKQNQ